MYLNSEFVPWPANNVTEGKPPNEAETIKTQFMLRSAIHRQCRRSLRRSFSALLESNPLYKVNTVTPPHFAEIKVEHAVPAVSALVAEFQQAVRNLEQQLQNNVEIDDLVQTIERIRDKLAYSWGVLGHLNGVRNTHELREAYQKLQPQVIEAFALFSQSKTLYEAHKAVQAKLASHETSSGARQRLMSKSIKDFELAGVGLSGKDRQVFNDLRQSLATLSTTFNNNRLDAVKEFQKVITDMDVGKSLPEPWRVAAAEKAAALGYSSATADDGPWVATLDPISLTPILQNCSHRGLREELYR